MIAYNFYTDGRKLGTRNKLKNTVLLNNHLFSYLVLNTFY